MRWLAMVGLLGAVACGSSGDDSSFEEVTPGFGALSGEGTDGNEFGATAAATLGTESAVCSDAAKLVYVVSDFGDLYSFKPDALAFTKIGRLSCPGSGTFNSMAVDRSGVAWVNDINGRLFQVQTSDASCTATTYQPRQGGFARMGMAYSTDGASQSSEQLYVDGLDTGTQGLGLYRIDTSALRASVIGRHTGTLARAQAELTGTGDGRLYGFFATQPAVLAQIDRATGATSNLVSLTNVSTGTAWAFSFWGGDFWFYTAQQGRPSTVTRLKSSSDNSLAVVVTNVGNFRIVGAGVSTCAPTTPPATK